MRIQDPGYGNGYSAEGVRRTAALLARDIPVMLANYDATHIVVTGKSGVSAAYAALMLVDFKLCVVRKPGESSHGMGIEGEGEVGRYILLDDFVSSGATVRRVREALESEYHTGPKMVAVLTYQGGGESYIPGMPDVSVRRSTAKGLR